MDIKTQTKIREAIEKIQMDMKNDPELRRQVAQDPYQVLAERSGVNLDEVHEAHRLWSDSTAGTCPALTLSGYV